VNLPIFRRATVVLAAIAIMALPVVALTACDDDDERGQEAGVAKPGITIKNPRVRATETDVTAAYFTVNNSGAADKLLSVSVDSAVAGMAQLHTMVMQGGTAMMQQVSGIDVPENRSVELKPGGFHVMIMNVKRPLKEGEMLTLQLTFEKAGKVEIKAPVQPISGN